MTFCPVLDIACPAANTVAPSTSVTASWAFTYDGEGTRVKQVYTTYSGGAPITVITNYYFFGGAYEVETNGANTTLMRYYAIGGQTVAMYDGTNLRYLITDHLGSVVAVASNTGTLVSQQRYLPFGQVRTMQTNSPIAQTDLGYTGQRALDAQGNQYSLGLIDFKARFLDPYLKRWTQPDSIVPDGNPQSLNKYSYVINSPLIHTDPTGHDICDEDGYCYNNQRGKYQAPLRSDFGANSRISQSTDLATAMDSDNQTENSTPPPNDQLVDSLNGLATFFQGLALLVDGPLGLVEIAAAGVGCGATIEVGCIPGAAEIVVDFDILYNATPLNLAETLFSGASAALSIAADRIDDGKYGEATNTAIVTFLAGLAAPDPAIDAAIDLYAFGYATGYFNGVDTIMNGGGLRTKRR
jgi:RHS repeat-associated protein